MAEVVPGFGGDSSDEGSDDDDPEDDSSCLSDLGSDDKSEAASVRSYTHTYIYIYHTRFRRICLLCFC